MEKLRHFNKDEFVLNLLHIVQKENPKHRKDLGQCAHFVAEALRRSGVRLPNLNVPKGHDHAYLYEKHLISAGFQQVAYDREYKAQKGDVMIWHPYREEPTKKNPSGVCHPHGHMQAFLGHHWFSDFRQNTPYPWPDYPHARCFVYRQSEN
jgi:hypothetical protein